MKKLLVVAMAVGAAVALSPTVAAEPSWTMPNYRNGPAGCAGRDPVADPGCGVVQRVDGPDR